MPEYNKLKSIPTKFHIIFRFFDEHYFLLTLNIYNIFSDYRKADSECDDGSVTPKPKPITSITGHKVENGNSIRLPSTTETTKSPKSNGATKQGGRRKTQTRSKSSLSSSQNITSNVSDDDSDVENGVPGVEKTLKNNRRKRNEKEKVINEN